jgi:hypothetical protein
VSRTAARVRFWATGAGRRHCDLDAANADAHERADAMMPRRFRMRNVVKE